MAFFFKMQTKRETLIYYMLLFPLFFHCCLHDNAEWNHLQDVFFDYCDQTTNHFVLVFFLAAIRKGWMNGTILFEISHKLIGINHNNQCPTSPAMIRLKRPN